LSQVRQNRAVGRVSGRVQTERQLGSGNKYFIYTLSLRLRGTTRNWSCCRGGPLTQVSAGRFSQPMLRSMTSVWRRDGNFGGGRNRLGPIVLVALEILSRVQGRLRTSLQPRRVWSHRIGPQSVRPTYPSAWRGPAGSCPRRRRSRAAMRDRAAQIREVVRGDANEVR
jgi:hypothetical protein